MLFKGTITVPNTGAAGLAVNNTIEKVIFKNCAPFTDCITEINNKQVDDAQETDIIMPMYNLIEYSDAYSKTSGNLWQYYRDEPALDVNGQMIDFPANKKIKQEITEQAGNGGTKDVEIMVPLKYLNSFWRTLETPLINKISLKLKWSKNVL